MLRPLILAATLLCAAPAFATPEALMPGIADVVGVAANDILNIRAEPNAQAQIRGTLKPDAKGIEITGFDASGKWAQVSMGETSGWASGKFLRLRGDTWKADALPATLGCFGTEPFWSLRRTSDGMEFSTPDGAPRKLELRKVMDRGLPEDATRALIAGDAQGRLTAIIQPQICSDGMSDRKFGLSATVIMDGGNSASRMLTGCCSIAAR